LHDSDIERSIPFTLSVAIACVAHVAMLFFPIRANAHLPFVRPESDMSISFESLLFQEPAAPQVSTQLPDEPPKAREEPVPLDDFVPPVVAEPVPVAQEELPDAEVLGYGWDRTQTNQGPRVGVTGVVWANQLRKQVSKYFNYPPNARAQRFTDMRVVIEIDVDVNGRLAAYRWVKRSKHNIFNQTAYLAIVSSVPFPPPPKEMDTRFRTLRLPFNYGLIR